MPFTTRKAGSWQLAAGSRKLGRSIFLFLPPLAMLASCATAPQSASVSTPLTTAYRAAADRIIARGAAGITDNRSPSRFSAGGISGTLLDIFPGYSLGEQRRMFGVRGYPPGAEAGIRAYSASLEYRVPISAPSKGFRFIPVFIDRTSVALFGEMGRAYCPPEASTATGICRPIDVGTPVMRSAGAELNIDTGVQLDFEARLRLGVAFPLKERERFGANRARFYTTFGTSF